MPSILWAYSRIGYAAGGLIAPLSAEHLLKDAEHGATAEDAGAEVAHSRVAICGPFDEAL